MEPIIQMQNVSKRFGDLHVLRAIDLDVPRGQMVSIIGPSGSGKSTLLRLLMTLEQPDAGSIRIDGEPLFETAPDGKPKRFTREHIRKVRGKIGMVFQQFNLFPHMRVLDNVMEAPQRVLKLNKAAARERAEHYLDEVGLRDKLKEYPSRLSGGQKQRVAIARALAMEPKIMLFDEITSALDPELVGGILDLIARLGESHSMTMLIVTHEMRFARTSSERTLFFDGGVIVEDDDPERIFSDPKHERTREFLHSILGQKK